MDERDSSDYIRGRDKERDGKCCTMRHGMEWGWKMSDTGIRRGVGVYKDREVGQNEHG